MTSPPSTPPTADDVGSIFREGIIANATYIALIAGSLGAATLLIVINRKCGSHELPRAMRMDWSLIVDVGFGILDFLLKVSFFLELRSHGPFGLVVACACVYATQILVNAFVELRLLASHRRLFKSAKHEADKLLGIADMRRRRFVWNVVIFLSVGGHVSCTVQRPALRALRTRVPLSWALRQRAPLPSALCPLCIH